MARAERWLSCALLMAALQNGTGCQRHRGPPILLLEVSVQGSPPPVMALAVVLTSGAGMITRRYAQADGTAIVFPTTLSAEVDSKVSGDITVDISAFDAQGVTVARGRQAGLTLRAGVTQTLSVILACASGSCNQDGGAFDGAVGDGAADAVIPTCGNGRLDPGEACDTAIAAGQPGACPVGCDDGSLCTTDTQTGTDCAAVCVHTERTDRLPGDNCCPAGASNADDPDCSPTCGNGTIESGETCDLAITPGLPGACPTGDSCVSADPCTTVLLTSAGTCQSRCLHLAVTTPSGQQPDGCCPDGVTAALDVDCPALCGNGLLDPGEMCDPAIAAPQAGACPPSCDDGNPCTADQRNGTGCQATCTHTPITSFAAGDGCCPSGSNRNQDSDCPAKCGNSVLEEGETCDPGASSPVPCPASCPASPSACLKRVLTGDKDHCDAACEVQMVTTCSAQKDGCCPAGCNAATDPDCSATCGDGAVDAHNGELCDTAIVGGAGACPTRCSDGLSCTADFLVSAGTCQAACVFIPITTFAPGDACCPPGGHFAVDPDCAPVCGNGIVETPGESCDFGADPAACASSCPPSNGCNTYALQGSANDCSARCVPSAITTCQNDDGCCPATCDSLDDDDCQPTCGNGVVEPGESCDRGISAGVAGACVASCDDENACTMDFSSGTVAACSRRCSHVAVTACISGDHCCPPGCAAANDSDCGGTCGDGLIGGGETCDPPTSCPTSCPDDGDRCTDERLIGDPARCTAACGHLPITACSGAISDGCCPTGCDPLSDSDC
ncbi:MAG TPA: hypothetical protein VH374_18055 [Polyangia bacterium]|jgi:hypothetical protein|nr:hypothetical protein [Polyangia bacterium]